MNGLHPIAQLVFDTDNYDAHYATEELNELCDFVMETTVDGQTIPK